MARNDSSASTIVSSRKRNREGIISESPPYPSIFPSKSKSNQTYMNDSNPLQILDKQHRQQIVLQCIHEIITNLSDTTYFSKYKVNQNIKDQDSFQTNIRNSSTPIDINHDKHNPAIGLEKEYRQLLHVLRGSLLSNKHQSPNEHDFQNIIENTAVLLTGPRGHGKKTLLEKALSSIQKEADQFNHEQEKLQKQKKKSIEDNTKNIHIKDDQNHIRMQFRVIRLNGIFLQNDAQAFKEIIRQLGYIEAEEAYHNHYEIKEQNYLKPIDSSTNIITNTNNTNWNSHDNVNSTTTTTTTTTTNTIPKNNSIASSSNDNDTKIKNGSDTKKSNFLTSKAFYPRISHNHANITSLDDALRRAHVDSIPILIVLYELDAFVASSTFLSNSQVNTGISTAGKRLTTLSSRQSTNHGNNGVLLGGNHTIQSTHSSSSSNSQGNDKQMLLYHLLDRISSHRSNVSLVGLTSRLTTVDLFERRVKSRAQGNLCFIYCGHGSNFDQLLESVMNKFISLTTTTNSKIQKDDPIQTNQTKHMPQKKSTSEEDWRQQVISEIYHQIRTMIGYQMNIDDEKCSFPIRNVFEKAWKMGKDVRWFCHVIMVALSLMMKDYKNQMYHNNKDTTNDNDMPTLSVHHMTKALTYMGESLTQTPTNSNQNSLMNTENVQTATAWMQKQSNPINHANPRIQALLDLPESQIAILLAIKRILYRRSQTTSGYNSKSVDPITNATTTTGGNNKSASSKNNKKVMLPLTYKYISDEYKNTFASKQPKHMSSRTLFHAFLHLLDSDLIKPAMDCYGISAQRGPTGSRGVLQYEFAGRWNTCLNATLVERMPIHVMLELERELEYALKGGWLNCSTILKDWGMKMNSS